jgi:hypothetical protein
MTQLGFDFIDPSSVEEARVRAARGLPSDTSALLREAKEVLRAVNTAMLHGDNPGSHLERLEAIAGHLLGFADFEDASEYLDAALAAPNGTSPLWWGQRANFVLTAQGCRSWVEAPGCLSAGFGVIVLHAVDYDRPWLTRSGFLNPHAGRPEKPMTFAQHVRRAIADWRLVQFTGRRKPTARPLVPLDDAKPYLGDEDEPDEDIDPAMIEAWGPEGWLTRWLAQHPAK